MLYILDFYGPYVQQNYKFNTVVDFCVFKFMYMEFSNLIISKGGHFLHTCQGATCNIVFFSPN